MKNCTFLILFQLIEFLEVSLFTRGETSVILHTCCWLFYFHCRLTLHTLLIVLHMISIFNSSRNMYATYYRINICFREYDASGFKHWYWGGIFSCGWADGTRWAPSLCINVVRFVVTHQEEVGTASKGVNGRRSSSCSRMVSPIEQQKVLGT